MFSRIFQQKIFIQLQNLCFGFVGSSVKPMVSMKQLLYLLTDLSEILTHGPWHRIKVEIGLGDYTPYTFPKKRPKGAKMGFYFWYMESSYFI